jgi:hypothetical protein
MTERHDADPLATGVAPELSVVLPAYNEVTLLGSTVTNIATGLDERGVTYELVVVENGSHDGTLRLARLLAAQLPSIRVLTMPVGDYGAALRAGFRAARGEIVVNFDVDYYDLAFLDQAIQLLQDTSAALVVASKRAAGAQDRRPLHRRLVTFVFTTILGRLFGLPVSDAHGMKAMRRAAVAGTVEECTMTRNLFDVELVLRAGRSGLTVLEVPAVVVERRPPRSAITRRALETVLELVQLALVLRRVPSAGARTAPVVSRSGNETGAGNTPAERGQPAEGGAAGVTG